MPIYRVSQNEPIKIAETSFSGEGMKERDLQRMFKRNIDILVPDAMVLAEEYGDWEDSRRRIDLLCLDRDARLVIVELKRTEDGGHMDLQAIRYAAMVSTMTFDSAGRAHQGYLNKNNIEKDASQSILDYLGWSEPRKEDFASETAIVLASAEFSKELTTAVFWLSDHDIDIRCVRLKPYKLNEDVVIDIEQIIPIPEASDYQVRVREKNREERRERKNKQQRLRFRLSVADKIHMNLTKRRLILLVVLEAAKRGANPANIFPESSWLIVAGRPNEDGILSASRVPKSSTAETKRFFTKNDELIYHDGLTFAFSNQWGRSTLDEVDRIIRDFKLDDVSYEEMS